MNRIYICIVALICFAIVLTGYALRLQQPPLLLPPQPPQLPSLPTVTAPKATPVNDTRTPSEPNLTAESAISVLVYDNTSVPEKVLFAKDPDKRVPIASVTKLITANAIVESIRPETLITISAEAVGQPENAGQLIAGEVYRRDELLYPLLIESSNDAAYAFAEAKGWTNFISAMKNIAQVARMTSSTFANPSGLDSPGPNLSTARDLVHLIHYTYREHPNLILITQNKKYVFTTTSGITKTLRSTNKLLSTSTTPFTILGGKTGETVEAEQALVIISSSPIPNSTLIHVVLRSTQREKDMLALMQWVHDSYAWNVSGSIMKTQ